MQWHLLNQHYVNLDYPSYAVSILEELVSSEQQLVQLLVSGMVSRQTMNSVRPLADCSLIDRIEEYRQ